MAALLSTIYTDPARWQNPDPGYAACLAVVGGGVNTGSEDVANSISNIATRSPVLLACIITGDPEHIYVLNSPRKFVPDPLHGNAYDDHIVCLCGNDLDAAYPVVLSAANAFSRVNNTACLNIATITGANGFAGGTTRSGPHNDGDANTDNIRARRVTMLPFSAAGPCLTTRSDGRYGLQEFYDTFIQPGYADANTRAIWAPVLTWFRLAVTDGTAAGNPPVLGITPVTSPIPADTAGLNQVMNACKAELRRMAAPIAPVAALTGAQFAAGINDLQNVIQTTNTERMNFDRDRATKTFTDVHGLALAEQVQRLCGAGDDSLLPPIHGLMAKGASRQHYGALDYELRARALATELGVDADSAPVASTYLTITVFRDHKIAADGLRLGEGLSPFSVTCGHHTAAAELRRQAQAVATAEAGSQLTVSEAKQLTSSQAKLPANPIEAGQKLQAFSIAVDVYFGVNHRLSVSLRSCTRTIFSSMVRIGQTFTEPADAQRISCSILFDVQQDVFSWIRRTGSCRTLAEADAVPAPTFEKVMEAVRSQQYRGILPNIPDAWQQHLTHRQPELK